ncbi:PAS domain-containing methyl-accepting chemotaxis protein [Bacterioplanoides sp.]|uniref:methyl-accepting chemotaxis protein n=1 Tax=Bacterioplanoides sp. TaxID=2066072 RepID=UPI003AFFE2E6
MPQEQTFSAQQILLSTTDTDSHITYANDNFCQISGYQLNEMQGKAHNLVRHPDMPKQAFGDLWQHLGQGQSWMGPVKNRCKNGDYYWVDAFVTPIKDQQGRIVEYQSVRTKPDPQLIQRAQKTYQQLRDGKQKKHVSHSGDSTLWPMLAFVLLTLVSFTMSLFSDELLIATLVTGMISAVSGVLFYQWRQSYLALISDAKSVFNNPLMAYLYSGRSDDIGMLRLALKKREAEVNAVAGRVKDDSELTLNMAYQSSTKGKEVARLLNSQKSEIESIAAAVNQMSASVRDMGKVVTSASDSAGHSQDLSYSAQHQVAETIGSISQLSEQLNTVDHVVSRLVSGTQAITQVLNDINSIAEQTNLLALNAAIEAARAGEQGRGFAVVAEEVRALAQRTQQSTEEINSLLTQLKTESDSAIEAVHNGNTLSKNCVESAQKAGDSLTSITQEISELAEVNLQITTSMQQQSQAADQINQNITAIADVSAQSECHGREASEFSEQLVTRLQQQKNLVEQFVRS